jgi:heme exporter protein B
MMLLLAMMKRELRLALRRPGDLAVLGLFFALCATLFPLGVGPEPLLLARIAPGVILASALLASLLSLDRLYLSDYEDGSLELLAIGRLGLTGTAITKSIAHWLTTGLPLTLMAPLLGIALRLPAQAFAPLCLALVLATPILSLIGATGAALALGARRGGALLALLVLPFYAPTLIFAAAAIDQAATGQSARPHLLLLAALLAITLPLAPLATAAALRASLD